jgi:hypothetical protein
VGILVRSADQLILTTRARLELELATVVQPRTKIGCEDRLQVVESGSRYLQTLKFVVLERMPVDIEQPAGAPVLVVLAVIRKGV